MQQMSVLGNVDVNSTKSFHFELLNSEFEKRKAKNSRYSLRAYARQMGVHPSTLSSVLSGKRLLSAKDAYTISEKLDLDPKKKREFFSSLFDEKKKTQKEITEEIFARKDALTEEDAFDVIAEWEHFVLLFLVQTENFQLDFNWISLRMDISAIRAEKVFRRLVSAGLLELKKNGSIRVTKECVSTSDEKTSLAIQKSHRDSLKAAQDALSLDLNLRDLTSYIFNADPKDLPKLKKEIRRFHNRISKLRMKSNYSEVYELVIALFPRTKRASTD